MSLPGRYKKKANFQRYTDIKNARIRDGAKFLKEYESKCYGLEKGSAPIVYRLHYTFRPFILYKGRDRSVDTATGLVSGRSGDRI
jgi:hypothetical protein